MCLQWWILKEALHNRVTVGDINVLLRVTRRNLESFYYNPMTNGERV